MKRLQGAEEKGLTVSSDRTDLVSCGLKCPTHVTVDTSPAEQLLEVGGEVVAAVVLLDPRRPVVLACADEHLLAVI